MIHDSYLFDFQAIINDIRESLEEHEEEALKPVLDAITETTELEDLPLYKRYLSIFDVEHDLGDLKLHYPAEFADCEDDFVVLFRLVAGSFSSNYSLEFDEETETVDLIITVESGDNHITKKLHDLWSFQIARLFEIYIKEQLNLEGLRDGSDSEMNAIEEERKMRLLVYQKKMRQLKNEIDSGDILSDMDDLLNS